MPNYSNTIIYKICCKDPSITDIYIGSTCNFRARKAEHKFSCNNETCKEYNKRAYQFIRAHGGWDNFSMIMIHEASVENKLQKGKLEREFIEEMKPTLNIQLPTRTKKEWNEANKEKIKEWKQEYREANKEKIIQKAKEYYEDNKEKILSNKREKFNCECGGKYTNSGKSLHMNSKKHQNYINSK